MTLAVALALASLAAGLALLLRRRSRLAGERMLRVREQAAAAERERIYRDLHDDLGAKLLTLAHTAPSPEIADLARSALQDLRDVVSRTRGEPGSLQMVLGEIRREAEHRLQAAAAQLDWEQEGALPDPLLDPAQALHLYRIVREAISNALRHARAQRVRIRVRRHGGTLYLDVTDDGAGAAVQAGSGAQGMRRRAQELQGALDWTAGTVGGTKVVLQFPLPPD